MSNDSTTRSLSAWFVSAVRSNGETFVKLDDGAPEWLSDAVREAHGDEFPDDGCYDRLQSIAWFMENYAGPASDGVFAAIRGGQFLQLDAMASVMLGAVVSAHESYVDECEAEELEAHTLPMWLVHGMPAGPLGVQS